MEIVSTRTDAKGRKQPAHKSPAKDAVIVAAADRAEAGANQSKLTEKGGDPSNLIASFAAQVRADGLDLARRIGPVWPTFVERLREVIDEIELEAERWWALELHQSDGMPDIPEFLRRQATS